MPTTEYHDWWITYPLDLWDWYEDIPGTPTGQWGIANDFLDAALSHWVNYPPNTIGRAEVLLGHIVRLLPYILGVAKWGLVLPDAMTIGEDISVGEVDLTRLYARLDAAENRLAILEGIEPPTMPTLDSLTVEAQERRAEIARTWFDLFESILDLAG